MTTPHGPRKRLPNNPSEENLRKQAKQLAKDEGLQLAAAQRRLAIEYGYKNWAELMRAVSSRSCRWFRYEDWSRFRMRSIRSMSGVRNQ